MRIKSVSGITCYAKNLNKTIKFYESLGFVFRKKDSSHATAYSNWFWIDFLSIAKETRTDYRKEAKARGKGAGAFIALSVDDVDAFYKFVTSKKIKPATKPQDTPYGNREFVLCDPDGYRLVIFKRK